MIVQSGYKRTYTSAKVSIKVAFKLQVRMCKVELAVSIRVSDDSVQTHDDTRGAEAALRSTTTVRT